LAASDRGRLSVAIVDVADGHEDDFHTLAREFAAVLLTRGYGRAEMIRDEGQGLRFYAVRHWADAAAAELCHADPTIQALTARLFQIARVTHVVNGARRPTPDRLLTDSRRAHFEAERRTGFDRRLAIAAKAHPEQRKVVDRRVGPRRLRHRPGDVNLVDAARRAREYADAAFSRFKVGAALEAADGTVFTGCNVENATYGLTICAERVAMFKAISEGHRAFIRMAIVADTEAPTPPCGACRQILWEFGGNLEIQLASLDEMKGTHQLKDLLPLPFDARLL
jgi:cytidine deaminase